jgi:hypothetical protein
MDAPLCQLMHNGAWMNDAVTVVVTAGFSAEAHTHCLKTFAPYEARMNILYVVYAPHVKQLQEAAYPDATKEDDLYKRIAAQLSTCIVRYKTAVRWIVAKSAGAAVVQHLVGVKVDRIMLHAPAFTCAFYPHPDVTITWCRDDKKIPIEPHMAAVVAAYPRHLIATCVVDRGGHDFNADLVARFLKLNMCQ